MIRIMTLDEPEAITMTVDGKLSDQSLDPVESCCMQALSQIAAQVLGYVGVDDAGLGGLEQKFESQLHGVPGCMFAAMDARRRVLGSSESEPEPGANLVLTIDSNIQFLAERALDHAMERTQAANGTVVVQDVHTGQILALAIRPTFNPNQFRRATPALLRDHAVSDVYEPGSTYKLVDVLSRARPGGHQARCCTKKPPTDCHHIRNFTPSALTGRPFP